MKRCSHCGVQAGEYHKGECQSERCPFCGGQLLGCGCWYILLGYPYDRKKRNSGLPEEIYKKGLPPEQKEEWLKILSKKGRIPHIPFPTICCHCGRRSPRFFKVSDEEWEYYIPPEFRNKVVCRDCFKKIKRYIDRKQGTFDPDYYHIYLEWKDKIYGPCRGCGKNKFVKEIKYMKKRIYLCYDCGREGRGLRRKSK